MSLDAVQQAILEAVAQFPALALLAWFAWRIDGRMGDLMAGLHKQAADEAAIHAAIAVKLGIPLDTQ